jgi:hypothetical protein
MITGGYFEFGQSDFKTTYVRLTDNFKDRYDPPTRSVNKPKPQETLKLEMSGFELIKAPFGFKFTDTRNDSNVLLTTENLAFVMMDKYL